MKHARGGQNLDWPVLAQHDRPSSLQESHWANRWRFLDEIGENFLILVYEMREFENAQPYRHDLVGVYMVSSKWSVGLLPLLRPATSA
jgi:hypothetical protein